MRAITVNSISLNRGYGGMYANHGYDAISSPLGGVENGNALVVSELLFWRRHVDDETEEQ